MSASKEKPNYPLPDNTASQDVTLGDNSECTKGSLLRIENLNVSFQMYDTSSKQGLSSKQKIVLVIQDLSLEVNRGELVAIVGASGSGKTLLADAILGIFDANEYVSGNFFFNEELMGPENLALLRGREIAYVPQSVDSLDPLMKIGPQVRGVSRNKADAKSRRLRQRELFERYELDASVEQMYPYELSGGMARRVLLCCALIEQPKLLVADEPTPGMDVNLAKQAMEDLRSYAQGNNGVVLITHDISLALDYADRVAVFNDGSIIEEFDVKTFSSPEQLKHPFSRALISALPEFGMKV